MFFLNASGLKYLAKCINHRGQYGTGCPQQPPFVRGRQGRHVTWGNGPTPAPGFGNKTRHRCHATLRNLTSNDFQGFSTRSFFTTTSDFSRCLWSYSLYKKKQLSFLWQFFGLWWCIWNLLGSLPIFGPFCNCSFLDMFQGRWYHSWGTWKSAPHPLNSGHVKSRQRHNDPLPEKGPCLEVKSRTTWIQEN